MRPRLAHGAVAVVVAVWALLVSPLLGRMAWAAGPGTGDKAIDKGIALYNDLEYEKATTQLNKALANPKLTQEQKTEGYKILGLAYVAIGRTDQAKQAFQKLLEIDPNYTLPRTENPKALDLFDSLRPAAVAAVPVQVTQSASPAQPSVGDAITVNVAVVDPSTTAQAIVVFHRTRGQLSYSTVTARAGVAKGKYSAVIPGTFVAKPALEYYVVAQNAKGETLANDGSADAPNMLVVSDRAKAGGVPLTSKWWFWTSVAGVVVLGAVAGVVLASGGSGSSEDATVNVTVNYTP